ncbi:G patch domain-containing protein 1-like isoform X2 [Styela clava]
MSSSDENEFPLVKYGTPLEEIEETDIPKKPIAVHEQVVTDEQGRRRFHGAFTGGFSAGYYNTVDTKEGWKPSTFKSSRSDRTKKQNYAPEDFMDDEDKSEYGIAPEKIVPQSIFSDTKKDQQSLKRKENFTNNATMLLGLNMLESLIVPVSNNIGVKLLQKMGWKPGQGIGPKVKRPKKTDFIPENITFAPEDTVPMSFIAKTNIFGLGYTGMDPKLALHDKKKKSSAISLRTKSGAKLSFAGQAFGVGAYEDEDQDIYAQDSMANYDMEMGEEKQDNSYGWTKPTKAIEGAKAYDSIMYIKKALEGFKKAEKLVKRKVYPPPLLPPDYNPHKRLELLQKSQKIRAVVSSNINFIQNLSNQDDKFNRLDPNQRGELLGEDGNQTEKSDQNKDPKSVFSLISSRDRERLERAKLGKQQVNEPDRSKRSALYEPFASNPAKQGRYKEYLSLLKDKKTDPYSKIEHDPNMTEWEREREKEEFTKASRFFQPLSATMSSRFTSESEELKYENEKEDSQKKAAKMKMFGLITRECVEWHPDPLLCKRFNVPNPYPNSDIVGIPGSNSDRTLEMFLHPDDFKRKKNSNLSQVKPIAYKDVSESQAKATGIISDTKNPPTFNKLSKSVSRWDKEAPAQGPKLNHENSSSNEFEKAHAPNEVPDSLKELSTELKKENEQQVERPSMELFKAIFENSDESSDEDSDSENDNLQTKNDKPNTATLLGQFQKPVVDNSVLNDSLGSRTEHTSPKISADVHRPAFHKFSSKSIREKKSPLHESANDSSVNETSMTLEIETTDSSFGPALPPVKIPKLWNSTDPEVLKPKKSKKSKHKKVKKHKKKRHK